MTIRSILRTGAAAVLIAAAVALFSFLAYIFILRPQITVIAPSGSIVDLIDLQHDSTVAQATVSGSSVTMYAGVGIYKVVVNARTGSQIFYTNTAWFKRVSLTFASPDQLTATLLAHQVAYNAIGESSDFDYLNTSMQTIEQVSGNTKTVLDSFGTTEAQSASSGAQAMQVIAGNRAIILTHNKLYALQSGHLSALRTDGFPDNITSIVIGTNPEQESFAVLINNTIYWYQSPSAQPQRILTLTKYADQLAVGGDQVIAYSTRMPDARQDIRYAYASTYAVDPLLISVESDSQRTLGRGPIVDASVSPDGQYATIEHRDAAYTDIVRLADGTTVQPVENADTLSPVWINNTRYVYGKGSSVWVFDVDTLSATALATLPPDQPVTSVTYNSEAQQYLVTTYPDEQGAAVYQLQ